MTGCLNWQKYIKHVHLQHLPTSSTTYIFHEFDFSTWKLKMGKLFNMCLCLNNTDDSLQYLYFSLLNFIIFFFSLQVFFFFFFGVQVTGLLLCFVSCVHFLLDKVFYQWNVLSTYLSHNQRSHCQKSLLMSLLVFIMDCEKWLGWRRSQKGEESELFSEQISLTLSQVGLLSFCYPSLVTLYFIGKINE